MNPDNLTNHFLIAMPGLADPNFYRTVTYICAHNDEGAMGIVINRPLDLDLRDVLQQMDIKFNNEFIDKTPVYQGGPVHTDRGFILHQPVMEWESSIVIGDDISITTSRDILQAIADGKGPERSFIALGYAGWAAGQLEQEIMENIWFNGPADMQIIFNTPSKQRWESAAIHLGVDPDKLSSDVGHA